MSQHAKKKSVAIINAKAPISSNNGKDALDLALIYGSYEQDTALFFHGDGVWQLINKQDPELVQAKNYLKTFSALEFYDIDSIYVCIDSLALRGLTATNFNVEGVQQLTKDEFAHKIKQHDLIYRF